MEYQQKLLMQGFQFAMGNHVVIQHPNGEYSFYLHLKKGSLKVQTGEVISQGDVLAEVGNSGNSTEPHLHFHLVDSPDFVNARSLPVRFERIKLYPDDNGKITHIHSGQIFVSN